MTKNQKIIILGGLLAVLLIAVISWQLSWRPEADGPAVEGPGISQPAGLQFMEQDDIANELGIATDRPVQIFRDPEGGNVVYKIIESEADIITDPEAVPAIRGSATSSTSTPPAGQEGAGSL